jgi:hypothetical protein
MKLLRKATTNVKSSAIVYINLKKTHNYFCFHFCFQPSFFFVLFYYLVYEIRVTITFSILFLAFEFESYNSELQLELHLLH